MGGGIRYNTIQYNTRGLNNNRIRNKVFVFGFMYSITVIFLVGQNYIFIVSKFT